MHAVAISSTGLFTPPEIITNEELVVAFNEYATQQNAAHAAEIEAGTRQRCQCPASSSLKKPRASSAAT